MIKLAKLFLTFSLFLFMTACADDDTAAPEPTLVGTWTAVSFEAEFEVTNSIGGIDFTSANTIVGDNLDYDLTFTETGFTTNGSYDIVVTTSAIGFTLPPTTTPYADVTESGTYTDNESAISINGLLYDFELDGVDLTGWGEEQALDYEINANDELTISQDETMTIESDGTTSTIKVTYTAVWSKQ